MGFFNRLLKQSSHKDHAPDALNVSAFHQLAQQPLQQDSQQHARLVRRRGTSSGGCGDANTLSLGGKRPPPSNLSSDSDSDALLSDSDSDDTSGGSMFALPACGSMHSDRRRAAIDFSDSIASGAAGAAASGAASTGSRSDCGDSANDGASGTAAPAAPAAAATLDRYADRALIHRGRNAYIYRARDALTGRRVALKCYPAGQRTKPRREALERELALLTAAAAIPGVLRLETTFETTEGTWLVLEACQGGTLMEAIANSGGRLPEPIAAARVALPLLRTLAQLHRQGIVHRHVKPEHLLMSVAGVTLGDFSAAACAPPTPEVPPPPRRRTSRDGRRASKESRRVSSEESPPPPGASRAAHDQASALSALHQLQLAGCGRVDALNHRIGSIEYMAPEALSKPTAAEVFHLVLSKGMSEDELPVYDSKVDVWSAGVLLFEALTGYQPFLADSAADMAATVFTKLRAGGDGGVPDFIARLTDLSDECRSFLAAALRADPASRPSASALLQHPWLVAVAAPPPPPSPPPPAATPLAPVADGEHIEVRDGAAAAPGEGVCLMRRITSEAALLGVDVRPGAFTRGRTSRVTNAPLPSTAAGLAKSTWL